MTQRPVGLPVPEFKPPRRPSEAVIEGHFARLERVTSDHAEPLFAAYEGAPWVWDYIPTGPFDRAEFSDFVASIALSEDPLFYAIFDRDRGSIGGFASFLRIQPEAGSIELGYIVMAPQLQQTRAATEALYLFMKWAFEAGYRRFEWKCNALNRPSRSAAERLGLSYEGVFRQAAVVKGHNRDTAWFASIDTEWPALKAAYEHWLAPENFDDCGLQRQSLRHWTAPILAARDPSLT